MNIIPDIKTTNRFYTAGYNPVEIGRLAVNFKRYKFAPNCKWIVINRQCGKIIACDSWSQAKSFLVNRNMTAVNIGSFDGYSLTGVYRSYNGRFVRYTSSPMMFWAR